MLESVAEQASPRVPAPLSTALRARTAAKLTGVVARGATGIVLAVAGLGGWSLVIGYLAGTAALTVTLWSRVPWRPSELSASGDSILVFEDWLETREPTLLETIERYNEAECRSTLALRDWLLERRSEAGITTWREQPSARALSADAAKAVEERDQLKAALFASAEKATRGG